MRPVAEDKAFFKKAVTLFGGSVGLGALAVCCALVVPLLVASVAGTVLGFLSGLGGVALAVGTGGVLMAHALRRRRSAGCELGRPAIRREDSP